MDLPIFTDKSIKVKGFTFRGSFLFLFPFSVRSTKDQPLKERICSCRSKFFLLREDPILKGYLSPGKQAKLSLFETKAKEKKKKKKKDRCVRIS